MLEFHTNSFYKNNFICRVSCLLHIRSYSITITVFFSLSYTAKFAKMKTIFLFIPFFFTLKFELNEDVFLLSRAQHLDNFLSYYLKIKLSFGTLVVRFFIRTNGLPIMLFGSWFHLNIKMK